MSSYGIKKADQDSNKETKVQISLYASKLKNVAGLGKGTSDPYAVVTLLAGGPHDKPNVLGKTEVIKNNLSPAWTQTFEAVYTFGKESKFNVGIFDEVRKTGKSKPMGSACFEIGEILGARGNIKAKKLKNGGTLFARVTRAITDNFGTLNAHFAGVQLKNVDGFFSKSDPFFIVSTQTNDPAGRTWQPVYRSEPIMNNLNPVWKPFSVPMDKLCGGNKDNPILIEVFDWEKSGKHQTMGSMQTTVNALIFLVGGNDRKLALRHKNNSFGFIQVNSASITGVESVNSAAAMAERAANNGPGAQPKKFIKVNGVTKINPEYKLWKEAQDRSSSAPSAPTETVSSHPTTHAPAPAPFGQALDMQTPLVPIPPPLPPPIMTDNRTYGPGNKPRFVDYLAGGTEINLVVAIDFTGSNGDPRKPGTLHYIHRDGQLNDYEKALTAVGSIVARYDSDKLFPVLGFGAKYNGVIQHCFQVGKSQELSGIAGMLEGYRGVFSTGLTMSGPTVFAGVIDYAAAQAQSKQQANAAVGEQSYTILLILTDGAVSDIEQTKNAIRNASTAPLSIVIVGIGNADFSAMQFLDDFHLQDGGRTRDIVQFVEFSRHQHDRTTLTKETLDEIPDQLVDYFYRNNIMPLPPTTGSRVNIEVEDYNSDEDICLDIDESANGEVRLADPGKATWDAHSYGAATRFLPPPMVPMGQSTQSVYSTVSNQSSYAPSTNASTPYGAAAPNAYAPAMGSPSPYAAATPAAVPATTVRVQAPANSYPGMQLQVQHPHTGQFKIITVPPGVSPGMAFTVQL